MTLLPIIDRELRLQARQKYTYGIRLVTSILATATTLAVLSPGFSSAGSIADSGFQLFVFLGMGTLFFCLIAGGSVTADSISSERRNGTLGLVLITRLKALDVILGKLLATSLAPFYGLLAILPILAIPFFLGGVTSGEFWRVTLLLTNTLFFSLAVGLYISVRSRKAYKAIAGTLGLLLATTGIPVLAWGCGLAGWTSPFQALLGPGYSGYLVFDQYYSNNPSGYWISGLGTHCLAWFFLWLAARRLAAEDAVALDPFPVEISAAASRPRPTSRAASYDAKQGSLLDRSPLTWLVQRNSARFPFLWTLIGVSFLGWLGGYLYWGRIWLRGELVFFTTWALHTTVKCWLALEASRRFAESRRNGELELLLITPLGSEAILQSHVLALKRQFRTPIILVVGLDLLLLLFGIKSPGWWGRGLFWSLGFTVGMALFVVDSYALSLVGLWRGLTASSALQAFRKTLANILILPWLYFLIAVVVTSPFLRSLGLIPGLWLVVGTAASYYYASQARDYLENQLQQITEA